MGKYNILFFEPAENWRDLINTILSEKEDFFVFSAGESSKFLNLIKTKNIHLVILSYDREGAQLLKWLKKEKNDLPIILLASLSVNAEKIYYKYNVNAILIKGLDFSYKDFFNKLYNIFNIKKTVTEIVDEEEIVFNIKGNWLAKDFILLFNTVENIYEFFLMTSKDSIDKYKINIDNIWSKIDGIYLSINKYKVDSLPNLFPLEVRNIRYSSPGNISLKGLGEPIKELKKFIESLLLLYYKLKREKLDIDYKKEENNLNLEKQKLDIEKQKLDIGHKKEENAFNLKKQQDQHVMEMEVKKLDIFQKKINIFKESGYKNDEIQKKLIEPLCNQSYIILYLISNGKIEGINGKNIRNNDMILTSY